MFDLLVERGFVADGSGQPGLTCDVGIAHDRVVAMGDLGGSEARRTIDATGLVVALGFVDVHTHSDLTLIADPRAESQIRQGVTTKVIGHTLEFEGGAFPTAGSVRKIYDELDLQRATQAYMDFFPALPLYAIVKSQIRDFGFRSSSYLGVMADFMKPSENYLTGNDVTVYAFASLDLKVDGPTVVVDLMRRTFNQAGEKAALLSLSYDFSHLGTNGLSTILNYVEGWDGRVLGVREDARELDLTIDYKIPKEFGLYEGLWLRLRASWLDEQGAAQDGTDVRVILRYDFPVL